MSTLPFANLNISGNRHPVRVALGGAATDVARAAAEADRAEEAAAITTALFSSRFGLPGVSIDFVADTVTEIAFNGVTFGNDAMAPLTFSRASTTFDFTGGAFVSFGSGVPAITDQGIGIWRAATNKIDFGQKFDESAHWTITGLATPVNGGTGPLGVNEYDITLSAGSSAHSIRQSESVESGKTYAWQALLRRNNHDDFTLALSGTPFSTGGSPLVYCNLATGVATITSGAIDAGIDPVIEEIAPDLWLLSIVKTASSTGTGLFWVYATSGSSTTWTAAGTETFTLISTGVSEGNCPVWPILTPGTGDVSRAADLVYRDSIDTETHTHGGKFRTTGMRSPTGYRLFLGTTANHVAIQQVAGKLVARSVVSSATVEEVEGPDVSRTDLISFRYNEVSGQFDWWVNGAPQTGFVGGPSGLTRCYLGSDAAGANQLGGYAEWFDVLSGLTTKGATGTGGESEDVAETELDDTDVFIQSDGAGGYNLLWRAPGGSDGLDFNKWNLALFNAGAPYTGPSGSTNLGRGAQGLADGGAWFVRRTGAATFGPNGQQYIDRGGAMFDSVKEQGVPEGNNYWAIVENPSEHGNMLETSHHVFVDGRNVTDTITTDFIVGKTITVVQMCECDSFINGAHVANRRGTYEVTKDGLKWLPEWEWLTALTCTSDSYTAMMGTKNVDNPGGTDNLFDLATYEEGSLALSRSNGLSADAVTNGNWVSLTGNGYFAHFMVETANDATQGFKRGVGTMSVDEADSTNNGKAYFRLSTSAIAVAAGDTWRHVARYQFGLTA